MGPWRELVGVEALGNKGCGRAEAIRACSVTTTLIAGKAG